MVRGLSNLHAAQIIAARGDSPFASIEDVWRRSGVPVAALEKLADADAFACLGLDRRQALWRVRGLGERPLPLFAAADAAGAEPEVALAPLTGGRELVEDYRTLQLSLRGHPLAFLRPELEGRRIVTCGRLAGLRDGARIEVAGLVLIRQRPGKGNVTFITLEDETGIANVILWQRKFEEQRRVVMAAAMIAVKGVMQKEGEVIHVVADRLEDMTPLLHRVGAMDFPHRFAPADGGRGAAPDPRGAIRVKSRDFH
jgi:error-prone DNA polymerase